MDLAPRPAGSATVVALVALFLSLTGNVTAQESTHVLVGVTCDQSFDVSAGGEPVEGSPFSSDSLGNLAFSFDDPAEPAGSLTMSIAPAGQVSPLVLSDITATAVTESTAVIEWTTSRPADATVEYGPTTSYGFIETRPTPLQISHAVLLTGLTASTLYHYRVSAADSAGIGATSGDRTFVTAEPPLTVSDARVADGDTTWARIAWTTNRPATSCVEFGVSGAYGSTTPLDADLVTSHDVLVEGLTPGVSYHFRAWSSDASADTAWSADLEFQTPLPPPPPLSVRDVIVAAVDSTSARITWTTNRPSDSMVEYGLTDGYGSASALAPDAVTLHDVTLTGLEPGTLYHFRVRSDDGTSGVAHSADDVFETDISPLSLGGVTVEEVGTSWAVISWSTSRPSTSIVEYGPTDAYGEVHSEAGPDTTHLVTLESLEDGALYHFRVRSVDAYESEAASADSTFETMAAGATGSPIITGVTASPVTATSVAVTWTTDRPATSQVLYGVGDSLDCATWIATDPRTDHRVVVSPLVPNTQYSFLVRSACGADTSCCSAQSFETGEPLLGHIKTVGPRILQPGTALASDSTAVVRWTIDRPCETWLEWGTDTSYGGVAPGAAAWRKKTHVYSTALCSLESATTYHYRVVAVGTFGDTTFSDDQVFRTLATMEDPGGSDDPDGPEDPSVPDTEPPDPPGDVVAEAVGRDIMIGWSPVDAPDLAGYQVYRTRSGDDPRGERVTDQPVTTSGYLDRDVLDGTYTYVVTSVDSCGNESEPSLGVTVEFSVSQEHALLLRAFPNPTPEGATFSFAAPPGAADLTLRIYSVDGRLVREIHGPTDGTHPRELYWDGRDRRGQPAGSGVYLCELTAGRVSARRKVTVLH